MHTVLRTLAAGAAAGVCVLVWWGCGEEPAADEALTLPEETPWSVQLHLHGSFSEGLASIDSQSFEATDVGLDAIWWSDHDWRITGYHVYSRFSFEEGPAEADRAGSWVLTGERFEAKFQPAFRNVERRTWATGDVALTRERAFDGEQSYQITAASLSPELKDYVAGLVAPLPGFRRPLASGLTLRVALWPEGLGEDGRVWVEARLSEHAPRPEQGLEELGPVYVRYVLGTGAGEPYREGDVLWVPLDHVEREWNQYVLPLSRDAAEGFPFLVAGDDSLTALNVGVSVRNEQAATVFVDALQIDAETRGEAMFPRQREVIDAVAAGHANLVQLQGVEVSYLHPHLNEFSVDTRLLDYDELAEDSGLLNAAREVDEAELAPYYARRAVERAHARGGLISFNHFLGTDPEGREATQTREELLAELLANELYGADLVEVGYRDRAGHGLRDHLWVWDQLALQGGLRPVGVGVSDHHGGPLRWRTMENNFVSWVLAPSRSKADLIEGLRAGRVFFGDITHFDGTLELSTDGGSRMGQIVVTDRDAVELDIAVDGLVPTDRVIVVESGELARFLDVEAESFRSTQHLALPPGPSFVRIECLARKGDEKVYSNAIHFVREVPEGGVEPARLGIDFAGVRSRLARGFRVGNVVAVEGEGWSGVRIVGRGDGGALVLDTAALGPVEVELKEGLSGRVAIEDGLVRLTELTGAGRIVLRGRADRGASRSQ